MIRKLLSWMRLRAEATACLVLFLFPDSLLLLRRRGGALPVISRHANYITRGLSPFREAWWTQCRLAGYFGVWRQFLLCELLDWYAAWMPAPRRPANSRILVVNFGHLGDLIHLQRLLQVLASSGKWLSVDVLAGPWGKDLLEGQEFASTTWYWTPHLEQYHRGETALAKSFLSTLAFYRRIRAQRYEAVITCGYTSFLDIQVISAARPVRAVTAERQGPCRYLQRGCKVIEVEFSRDVYEAERLLDLAKYLGVEVPFEGLVPGPIGKAAQQEPWSKFPELRRPYIVIAPGAGWSGKQWPVDRLRAVARYASARYGVQVVGMGTRSEAPLVSELCKDEVGVDLAGKTTFRDAAAVLSRAVLYIGNDSGLLHLSAVLGLRTLSFFGPTSTGAWAPRGATHRCLKASSVCEGCIPWHPRGKCLHDHECMLSISHDAACAAVDALLGGNGYN